MTFFNDPAIMLLVLLTGHFVGDFVMQSDRTGSTGSTRATTSSW